MTYPRHVYRERGIYRFKGRNYTVKTVHDEAEEIAALKDGWYASREAAFGMVKDAIEAAVAMDEAAQSIDEDDREALEAEAKRLGVSFNARTKTETLLQRIADAK